MSSLRVKQSLKGKLNNAIVHEYPELEDLNVTPSMEEQRFKSDMYGYDNVTVNPIESESLDVTPTMNVQRYEGLFDVVTVDAIEGEELSVTPTEEEQVKEGLFDKVTVEAIQTEEKSVELDFSNSDVNEVTPTEGSYLKKVTINKDVNKIPENIAKDVVIDGITGTLEGGGEYNAVIDGSLVPTNTSTATRSVLLKLITKVPQIDTSSWKSTFYMFHSCENLVEIQSQFNTSNVTNMGYMYYQCKKLPIIPQMDTSNVTNMNYTFGDCKEITEIPQMDTSNVTNMSSIFYGCNKLTSVPQMDTSNVTNMSNMFAYCYALLTVLQLDASKVTSINSAFSKCTNLTNLYGLLNLGKAYTKKTENYSSYTLTLSDSENLTYESLMNVINNLYDLNLTYDVANGGTLYTQTLQLSTESKGILNVEEVAIATNKGWTVS